MNFQWKASTCIPCNIFLVGVRKHQAPPSHHQTLLVTLIRLHPNFKSICTSQLMNKTIPPKQVSGDLRCYLSYPFLRPHCFVLASIARPRNKLFMNLKLWKDEILNNVLRCFINQNWHTDQSITLITYLQRRPMNLIEAVWIERICSTFGIPTNLKGPREPQELPNLWQGSSAL